MAREVMRRKASDNVYLHKDFHGGLSGGIEYIDRHYGADAVREYLRQFASAFYAPLTAEINGRGLAAMKERIEHVYRTEQAAVTTRLSPDELLVEVPACPAVTHMRSHGYPVARLWSETSRTMYETICAGTPFAVEMLEYDDATGRSRVRFYRRSA